MQLWKENKLKFPVVVDTRQAYSHGICVGIFIRDIPTKITKDFSLVTTISLLQELLQQQQY